MAEGTRVGSAFAHAIVDDHSRVAYVELLDDEKAQTVTAFVCRALAWFAARGIHTKRLMTDNAWSYTHNNSLRPSSSTTRSSIYGPRPTDRRPTARSNASTKGRRRRIG